MLTITTGFGIAAFYPQPIKPDYPNPQIAPIIPRSCYETPQESQSADCQKLFNDEKQRLQEDQEKRKQYNQDMEKYKNTNAGYTRTTIFFGISIGALFAVLGLILIKKSKLVSTGLLLGGILTAVLTRFLVGFASLGATVTGTQVGGMIAFVEFAILAVLSVAVIYLGIRSFGNNISSNNAS